MCFHASVRDSCALENGADANFICHVDPVSLKAALDSASCLQTASTVNREIAMPNVVLVCLETGRLIPFFREFS
jgi:hypothetical protein